MEGKRKSPAMVIAAIIFAGIVGLGVTMYVLVADDASPGEGSPESEVAKKVSVEDLEPMRISTEDRAVRWMYIDPDRGLRHVQDPADIPAHARGTVVVWAADFPEADVYYVVDLFDANLQNQTVEAHALSPEDFEERAKMMVRSTLLAQDTSYLAEDLVLDIEIRDVRNQSERKRNRRRTVIERMNRYPSFRIPGR